MRYAPAYSANRFPGDFAGSALCGFITAAILGPLVWWLSRHYLQRAFPHHPELLGAAMVAGALDGFLLAALAFGCCFAVRIWIFERRQRRHADAALRSELAEIAAGMKHERGTDGGPPIPRH